MTPKEERDAAVADGKIVVDGVPLTFLRWCYDATKWEDSSDLTAVWWEGGEGRLSFEHTVRAHRRETAAGGALTEERRLRQRAEEARDSARQRCRKAVSEREDALAELSATREQMSRAENYTLDVIDNAMRAIDKLKRKSERDDRTIVYLHATMASTEMTRDTAAHAASEVLRDRARRVVDCFEEHGGKWLSVPIHELRKAIEA